MTPLGRVVAGLLLVVLDLRIDGFDLLPDLLGWPIVLAGLFPLSRRHGGFAVAAVAAGVGALLAVPQLVTAPGPVLGTVETIVETAVVFGTCTGILAVVAEAGVGRTANRVRWADLGVAAVAGVAALAAGDGTSVRGDTVGLLLLLGLVGLVIFTWFLLFLWSIRARPEVGPTGWTGGVPAQPTP